MYVGPNCVALRLKRHPIITARMPEISVRGNYIRPRTSVVNFDHTPKEIFSSDCSTNLHPLAFSRAAQQHCSPVIENDH